MVCTTFFCSSFYAGWELLAVAAASLSVVVAAMLIMFSRLFSLRNLEQTAKTEFVYAVSTVLIVIMVAALAQVGEPLLAQGAPLPGLHSSVAKSLYLSTFQLNSNDFPWNGVVFSQNTLIDWMILYMETPARCVSGFMKVLYGLSIPVEAISSVYMEIFMSEVASGFGIKWLSERIATATKSMSFYMYMYYLIVHTFTFIKYYAGFFFSVGVALRAFPPVRGAGAFMMAISVGIYFVFPLTYILVATMSLPHVQTSLLVANPNPAPLESSFKYDCMLPSVPDDLSTYACQSPSVGSLSESVVRLRANYGQLTELVTYHLSDLALHLLSAICLFPLIAMVVFMTFTLNAANLFGGNIPEIGRGLVKLI
ncbi:hypothetical protein HY988_00760 [Candidatus Micrarchaeota archaeon]|nr:hypothetical protein [Candidatus Micrarchaeota archaeon]